VAKEMGIVERVRLTIDRVKDFGEGKENDYGNATAVIRDARETIAEARTAGVDIADLRSQMPGLERKARRFYADKAVNRVRKLGEGRHSGYITPDSAIRDARNAIADAKTAGADVSDLESGMPEMERLAWRSAAKKTIDRQNP
jgi:hypothetical protein